MKSERFLAALQPYDRILMITHDNPDPDAIASGWGLVALVKERLGKEAQLRAGGAVLRAENQRMIELLAPPIKLVDRIDVDSTTGLVFVDCDPAFSNHRLSDTSIKAAATIDHHEQNGEAAPAVYRDVRPNVAASATIVTQYLEQQQVKPTANLATALLYAIQTDAYGFAVYSPTDQRAVAWLSDLADFNKLADIQSAPLGRDYYADLLLAMESTFLYDNAALCFLPQAKGAEIVGEVADLLIRCVGVERVLCAAAINGDVLVSVRATPSGGDASRLTDRLLDGFGHGGGHRHRAGGKIARESQAEKVSGELQTELRNRWLDVCKIDQRRGTRLVASKEILQNL